MYFRSNCLHLLFLLLRTYIVRCFRFKPTYFSYSKMLAALVATHHFSQKVTNNFFLFRCMLPSFALVSCLFFLSLLPHHTFIAFCLFSVKLCHAKVRSATLSSLREDSRQESDVIQASYQSMKNIRTHSQKHDCHCSTGITG